MYSININYNQPAMYSSQQAILPLASPNTSLSSTKQQTTQIQSSLAQAQAQAAGLQSLAQPICNQLRELADARANLAAWTQSLNAYLQTGYPQNSQEVQEALRAVSYHALEVQNLEPQEQSLQGQLNALTERHQAIQNTCSQLQKKLDLFQKLDAKEEECTQLTRSLSSIEQRIFYLEQDNAGTGNNLVLQQLHTKRTQQKKRLQRLQQEIGTLKTSITAPETLAQTSTVRPQNTVSSSNPPLNTQSPIEQLKPVTSRQEITDSPSTLSTRATTVNSNIPSPNGLSQFIQSIKRVAKEFFMSLPNLFSKKKEAQLTTNTPLQVKVMENPNLKSAIREPGVPRKKKEKVRFQEEGELRVVIKHPRRGTQNELHTEKRVVIKG